MPPSRPDHVALRPLPPTPYVVTQRHLRHVGKDCLVAFDANLYSVPARKVRPRQLVEIRATKAQVILHSTVPGADGKLCWPPIRERSAAAPGSWTRGTGTACPPEPDVVSPPAMFRPSPAANSLWGPRPARCKPC
ncbi:Mu transposase domain-containing protein [Streptomyces violarus]